MSIHQFGNGRVAGLHASAGTKRRKPARAKQEQYRSAVYHGSDHREDTQRHKIVVVPA
jgi:hypothetical protein